MDRRGLTTIRTDPGANLASASRGKSCSDAFRRKLEETGDRERGICVRPLFFELFVRAINTRNSWARIGLDRRADVLHLLMAATADALRVFAYSIAPGWRSGCHFRRRIVVSLFRTAVLEFKSKTMADRMPRSPLTIL